MATMTAYLTPDYANTVSVSAATGTIVASTPTGVITVGKRRILHISAMNTNSQSSRCAVRYTLGLSTGTAAASPTTSSPFFLGDEGWTIDTGDLYDQLNFNQFVADNGTGAAIIYSITIMSKY
jgi:hypothetical protein